MARRKIIQMQTPNDGTTVALCADGTIWYLGQGDEAMWVRMADIPQDDEPETATQVGRQSWPPELNGMDLWTKQDGEAVKIIDRDTFWIAIASKDQIVAAYFSNDAAKLLDRPEASPETWNFDYEGQSFTVPANPIPF